MNSTNDLASRNGRTPKFNLEGGQMILIEATMKNNVPLVKALLKHHTEVAPILFDIPFLQSPLWIAMINQFNEIAVLLIKHGVDIDERIGSGISNMDGDYYDEEMTFLHLAVLRCNTDITQLLLERGADVNAKDSKGDTILHYAVEARCEPYFIQMLVDHGARPNAATNLGRTVFHMAVMTGKEELMRLIASYGVDITATHHSGATALHFAAQAHQPNLEVAQFLIDNGVPINGADRIHHCTPLHVALKTCNDVLVLLDSVSK